MEPKKPRRAIISQPAAVSLVWSALEVFGAPGTGDSFGSYGLVFGHRDFSSEGNSLYIDYALPFVHVSDKASATVAPYRDAEQLRQRLWTLQHPLLHATLHASRRLGAFHAHPVSGQADLSEDDMACVLEDSLMIVVGVSQPNPEANENSAWRLEGGLLKGRLDVMNIQMGVWYREGIEIVQYQPVCQCFLGADSYLGIE
jgi:hypothetical protein